MTEKTLPPPVMLVVSWQQVGSLLALIATLGLGMIGLGVQGFLQLDGKIDSTNARIDTMNNRIDSTNDRIDRVLELVQ